MNHLHFFQKVYCITVLMLAIPFLPINAQPNTLSPEIVSYIANVNWGVRDVHTDCEGNIVYVGGTASSAFAVSPNTISTSYNGGNCDVFITKINASGQLIWSTLLGGNQYDRAYAVEIDDEGFIYVAGRVGANIPITAGALQQNFAGDNNLNPPYGVQDGFVTKITPEGTIVWSTFIGGDGRGFVRDIDLDSQGNIWVGMSDVSPNFPHITPNAVQTTATYIQNPALLKLSPDGQKLLFGTFMADGVSTGGRSTVRVDANDQVYFLSHARANSILPITPNAFQPTVGGDDDFVLSKFDNAGNLLFCSYLGGSAQEEVETHSLEIDWDGNPIVAAYSYSTDYPVTNNVVQPNSAGGLDGVVTKISSDGTTILASTFLGGNQSDEIEGIGLDVNGFVYLVGTSTSTNFPVTSNAMQSTNKGIKDATICVLTPNLSSILYATYIGGNQKDALRGCHVDEQGKLHAGGYSRSANHPTVNPFNPSYTGGETGIAVIFRPNNLFPATTACPISFDIKVQLEGAYDQSSGLMRTDLYQLELLPGMVFTNPSSGIETPAGQPYHIAPWNYPGLEGTSLTNGDYDPTSVDWVLLSLRTGTDPSTEIHQTAGILKADGTVEFLPNSGYTGLVPGPYYLLIEHRNHVGVLSAVPVSVQNRTLTYDFTTQDSWMPPNGGFGQKELTTGLWGMFAADGDQIADLVSYDINGADRILWSASNGVFLQYSLADFDLSGEVSGADRILWGLNSGINSSVPK